MSDASRRALWWPLLIVALLTAALALLGDLRTASFSDAGGRLATIRTMEDTDSWIPDVGYWAESTDPTGEFHPLLYTVARDGRWVQAPTLPFVIAGRGLLTLGGLGALLAVAVVSATGTVWASARLSRWASGGSGVGAAWLVVLFSPIVFYATDFWEHAPAVAAALAALALMLDGRSWRGGLGAGLLAGLACVLRNEMLVVAVGMGVGLAVVGDTRRWLVERWPRVLAAGVSAVAVLAGTAVLDRRLVGGAVGADRGLERAEGLATLAGLRLRDALVTTIGLLPSEAPEALLFGALTALGIVGLAWCSLHRDAGPVLVSASILAVVGGVAVRLLVHLAAVPGFLVVSPLAALGALGARSPRERGLVLGALVSLPAIWLSGPVGQHSAQWGGRYLLVPTVVLLVVAAAVLERIDLRRPAPVVLVGLAAAVAAYGLVWHVHRTRAMAETGSALAAAVASDEVVVSEFPHLGRELGWWYGNREWLTVPADRDGQPIEGGAVRALDVAAATGPERIAFVERGSEPPEEVPRLSGYRPGRLEEVPFLWETLWVTHYRRIGP